MHDESAKTAEDAAKKAFSQHLTEVNQPHLVRDGNLQRCSVCGYPFSADVRPSMSVAFAEHLMKAHKPGQTTEDFNQAAARVVRESTENH